MAFFGVRLSDDLASRFDALAAGQGGRSKALRRLIEAAARTLDGAVPPAAPPVRSRSEKLTLRLRSEDLEALQRVSADAGMRRTEWAAALLRQRLTNAPQFAREQQEALLEVRRDLRRISNSLNTAVQALLDAGGSAGDLDSQVAELRAFQREVREQLDGVREGLAGNLAYWEGRG